VENSYTIIPDAIVETLLIWNRPYIRMPIVTFVIGNVTTGVFSRVVVTTGGNRCPLTRFRRAVWINTRATWCSENNRFNMDGLEFPKPYLLVRIILCLKDTITGTAA
jgi:hypothetical protein